MVQLVAAKCLDVPLGTMRTVDVCEGDKINLVTTFFADRNFDVGTEPTVYLDWQWMWTL